MSAAPAPSVVLDTNIVLDLWLYQDPATPPLLQALQDGGLRWLSTAVMREELVRVLAYAHIAQRLQGAALSAEALLQQVDRYATRCEVAPKAPYTCKDPDDQKFLDLAAAHRATLVSKDKAVLTMRNRMARIGVEVTRVWAPPSAQR
jgi:putative PIN family toxin of toxin-antitoxin system